MRPNTEAPFSGDGPPSSSQLPDVRPKKGRVVAVLVAIAVAGGAGIGVFAWQQSRAAALGQATAHASLARCLTGEEPLAQGETPSLRYRRIQLTALAVDPLKAQEAIWPQTCATYAHALHEALSDAGRASKTEKDTAYWAEHLGKTLKNPAPEDDVLVIVDALWEKAKKEKFAAVRAADMKPPPKAAAPLTIDALKGIAPLSTDDLKLDAIKTERVVRGESLRFFVDKKTHIANPLVCTLGAELACRRVAAALGDRELVLGGAADEGELPLLFAAPNGENGIYEVDGREVASLYAYGAYAAKGGARTLFAYDRPKKTFLLEHLGTGAAHHQPFAIKGVSDDRDVSLVFDTIVYAADGSLFAQRTSGSEHALPAATNLGAVQPLVALAGFTGMLPSAIRGCKSEETLAVVARSYDGEVLAMDTGDRWWPLRKLGGDARTTGNTMTCRGREVNVVRRDIVYEGSSMTGAVTLDHCTVDACSSQSVDLRAFFGDVREMVPADSYLLQTGELDGKLLAVWKAGRRGGIRMRLATPDKIASAEDTVLFDDLIHDGRVDATLSQVTALRLFTRSNAAVLLMQTPHGVQALKIDKAGKATPLAVRIEG